MGPFAWMAWTWQTGVFFGLIAATLVLMTVLALRYPETERVGVLGIATTRGDRLFISLLGAAIIHIVWLATIGHQPIPLPGGPEVPRLWGATIASFFYAAFVFRRV